MIAKNNIFNIRANGSSWIGMKGTRKGFVEFDTREHGIRAWLNLGHTFGHALEHEAQERGEDIHHGEAVAVGILLAARLSYVLST